MRASPHAEPALLLHLIHVLDKWEITTSARQIAGPHKLVVDVEDKTREALDNVGKQVADVQDLFARVLQRGDYAVPDRAALRGEGRYRGEGTFFEFAVGLVGGQERDLIHQ